MQNFYCNVVGSTSTKKLAPAQPPKWCADDQTKCVKGAKQMLAWNQAEGNNVVVPNGKSPAYNGVMGWAEGAQNDIFVDGPATSASTTASATSTAAPTTLSTQTKPATTTTSVASSAPRQALASPSLLPRLLPPPQRLPPPPSPHLSAPRPPSPLLSALPPALLLLLPLPMLRLARQPRHSPPVAAATTVTMAAMVAIKPVYSSTIYSK